MSARDGSVSALKPLWACRNCVRSESDTGDRAFRRPAMSVPKASTVANKFVKEYYTKLQNSPKTMNLFYTEKVSLACSSFCAALAGLPAHTHAPFAMPGRETLAATVGPFGN